jgi:hypothetical protein
MANFTQEMASLKPEASGRVRSMKALLCDTRRARLFLPATTEEQSRKTQPPPAAFPSGEWQTSSLREKFRNYSRWDRWGLNE